MLQFVRKTRPTQPVELNLPRAIQLAPDPLPRTLLQQRRTKGMHPSRKMDRMVGWSNLLERDFLAHLEFNAEVRAYSYRPEAGALSLDWRGKRPTFMPSYEVIERHAIRTFATVCLPQQLRHPDHAPLCEMIEARYREIGTRFLVVTEAAVYRSPRFENLQLIESACNAALPPYWVNSLLQIFGLGTPCTAATLEAAFGGGTNATRVVLSLIARGTLAIDLDRAFTPQSILRLIEEPDHE